MYFSLGQAAKEAGVAKSTISKALSSGKLSYAEKGTSGYKIDAAELFRVFPKQAKTDRHEALPNKSSGSPVEIGAYSPALEIQLAGLKHLIAEKERRISDLESDRAYLREEQNRMAQHWQDERLRLLKLIADQACAVKLLTDQREKCAEPPPPSFWSKLFTATRKLSEAA